MARKTLLTEAEIRQFMKLANIKPLQEMGGPLPVAGKDDDTHAETRFHLADGFALLVQDVEGDITVHCDAKLLHPALAGFLLDGAKHLQRRRFHGPDTAGALTMRADGTDRLIEAQPQALA